jgi:hypothetical protein
MKTKNTAPPTNSKYSSDGTIAEATLIQPTHPKKYGTIFLLASSENPSFNA